MAFGRTSAGGAAFTVLAVGVLWVASGYDAGSLRAPGPAFLPLLAAGAILVLALALLLRGLTEAPAEPGRPSAPWWPEPGAAQRVGLTVAGLLVYPPLLARVGFVPATFALLALLFALGEGRLGWRGSLLALVAALACDALFRGLLRVPLPAGWFTIGWPGLG